MSDFLKQGPSPAITATETSQRQAEELARLYAKQEALAKASAAAAVSAAAGIIKGGSKASSTIFTPPKIYMFDDVLKEFHIEDAKDLHRRLEAYEKLIHFLGDLAK